MKKLSVLKEFESTVNALAPGSGDSTIKSVKKRISFKGGYLSLGELEDGWWYVGMSKRPLKKGNQLKKFEQWASKNEELEAVILFERARDRDTELREL